MYLAHTINYLGRPQVMVLRVKGNKTTKNNSISVYMFGNVT
jgi:hypothetical protein